jgi:hypothetical protein
LRRVGSSLTFADGEYRLSAWMAENTAVALVESEVPLAE